MNPDPIHRRHEGHQGDAGVATPLAPAALDAIRGGDLAAALHAIAQASTHSVHRALAARLAPLLEGVTQVSLCPQLRTAEGDKSYGCATSDGSRVWLSLEEGRIAEETVLHECVHAGVQHMLQRPVAGLTRIQREARKVLDSVWMAARVDRRVAQAMSPAAHQQLGEFVAEALTHSALRQALQDRPWKLSTLWRGLKDGLLCLMGMPPRQTMLVAAMRAVDVLMERPSTGVVPRPQDTQAFRDWFGNSQAVNGIGQPRVVYHGTAADFDVFDVSRAGQTYGREDEKAFFFTGRLETAESAADDATGLSAYARKYQYQGFGGGYDNPGMGDYGDYDDEPQDTSALYNGGQNIMPVYLSLQNPLVIEARWGHGAGSQLENGPEHPGELIARAKREGYDGIIIKGRYLDYDAIARVRYNSWTSDEQKQQYTDGIVRRDARKHQTDNYFIAFRPEQIKSAIGNRGTFDPNDPSILHQAAWHGTPHRGIERFSTDHIGTGEGAQSQGWGLYFSGEKEVAEFYRQSLTGKAGAQLSDAEVGHVFDVMVGMERYQVEGQPGKIRGFHSALWTKRRLVEAFRAKLLAAHEIPEEVRRAADLGAIYEVEIPDDGLMLLWDEPLSKQPQVVRAAVDQLFASGAVDATSQRLIESQGMRNELKGKRLYELLTTSDNLPSDGTGQAASQALAAVGIKGIKYLDGGSRAQGEGTYNYVIFDGGDVQVKAAHMEETQTQEVPRERVRMG